jgi:hypothetical protein
MSVNLNRKAIYAEINPSEMDEELLPQVANDLDMDLNMGGELEPPDAMVVGHPEPGVPSREKVCGINVVQ